MFLRRLILVLFLSVSVFWAGDALAQSKTVVVLWHAYRGVERTALEKTVQTFNGQSQTISIKTLAVPFDALPDKISAAVPLGKGPDLFIFGHDKVGDWAESGILEPINFYLQKNQGIIKRYYPQTLESLIYRNSLYGLPLAFKSTALYYNKDLIPTPPKTTDELIEMGKKITDPAKSTYGLVYENTNFFYHSAWMHGYGAKVFDKSGNVTFDTPEMAKSYAFAYGLKAEHGIMPDEITNTLVTSLFNDGKAGMVISGPWFAAELKKGLNYGVAPLPVVSETGIPATPYLTSEGLMMSANSSHKAEAFEVMDFLTDTPQAAIRLKEGQQTVATKAAFDGYSNANIEAFRTQLENTFPTPNTPIMKAVWTPVTNVCGKVIGGRATPEKAVAEGQAAIVAAIEQSSR